MSDKGSHKRKARFSLVIIMTTVLLTACYPITRSKGKVIDDQGLPVAEAIVKIGGKSAQPAELKTNADGTFDFGEIKIISHQNPVEIELSAEKEGYIKITQKIAFDTENTDEIILRK